uniref:Integrator complex subunit 7 n=3 Tax=Parascaris univalens TaxID=6257 RepID=A0A915A6F2_PARUN
VHIDHRGITDISNELLPDIVTSLIRPLLIAVVFLLYIGSAYADDNVFQKGCLYLQLNPCILFFKVVQANRGSSTMDSDMQRSCEALGIVDKGLRAESLEEKMELLVNLKALMRETPIPYFINATVLRLLEVFRHNDSALRRFIVQIMGECSDELRVVYSKAEIIRRLMRISYSNDSLTRAFNLRLLATLSAVISDNKRVHHLIMKSVDCAHKDERAAAIVAMNSFATASKRFSEMALRKMQQVVASSKCSLRLKVYVVRVVAHLHADDETIVNAVDICERILFETSNKFIVSTVITSLTDIVRTRRVAMPRLVDALLRFERNSAKGGSLRRIVLRSLKALAPAADLLSSSTVEDICMLGERIVDREELVLWLGVIRCLIVQKVRLVNVIISDYIMKRRRLLFDRDRRVCLKAIQVFICLYSLMPSSGVSLALQTTFTRHIGSISREDSERFYRLLTVFIRTKACPSEIVYALVDTILKSPLRDDCMPHVLQFLIASAETHSMLSSRLFHWAANKLAEGVDFSDTTLFARLIYAPGVKTDDLPAVHWNAWGADAWTMYRVARTAMRNGHLKSVALPILEKLEHKAMCAENRLWLSSLKSICMATVEELKLDEIEHAIANYDQAVCTLEMLLAKKTWWHCFWFAERYVDCVRSTLSVLRRVLVTKNFTLSSFVIRSPSQQWKTCATNMMECYEKWHYLLRQCYDADPDTIVGLDVKCFECSLMSAALLWLVDEDSQLHFDSLFESFAAMRTSAVNTCLREPADWAKEQLDLLKVANVPFEKRLSNKYISYLMKIFERLCCGPVFLPRFFFQQLKLTEFKLNVSPQPSDSIHSVESEASEMHEEFCVAERIENDDDLSCLKVSHGSEIPFVVEGMIKSSSSCSIRTFIVTITVKSKDGSRMIRSWSETINSEEENCFKVQIPYLPQEDCIMKFMLEFVDESRRHWVSHSKVEVRVIVNEDDYEDRRRERKQL